MKPRGRYQKDGAMAKRLAHAHWFGFGRGYADKHYENRNFETGAEWLSWLAGWREGQVAMKLDNAKRLAAKEREERIMKALLGKVA